MIVWKNIYTVRYSIHRCQTDMILIACNAIIYIYLRFVSIRFPIRLLIQVEANMCICWNVCIKIHLVIKFCCRSMLEISQFSRFGTRVKNVLTVCLAGRHDNGLNSAKIFVLELSLISMLSGLLPPDSVLTNHHANQMCALQMYSSFRYSAGRQCVYLSIIIEIARFLR